MNIRRCEHCEKVFSPQASGAAKILCRFCLVDCEKHYATVRRYILENGFLTVQAVAEGCGISPSFVKGLVLDGKFKDVQADGMEDQYEAQRKRQLLQLMQQEIGPAAPEAAPATSTALVPVRKNAEKKSYGFGRD